MREAAAGLGLEEGGLFPRWVSGRADHRAVRAMEMCVFLWGWGSGGEGILQGAKDAVRVPEPSHQHTYTRGCTYLGPTPMAPP